MSRQDLWRFRGVFLYCLLVLVAICCENNNTRFNKTQYLESCGLSVEDMLLSDSQEDSLLRLVFDMEKSPNLHYRNELVNDNNLLSCKALLIEYGNRFSHGYNDSLLFAHYYALGVSVTNNPQDIVDLTLAYAKGQKSAIKNRIGIESFPYAKEMNDTLALQSISLIVAGLLGRDFGFYAGDYLGYDKNIISDNKAEQLLYWSEQGLQYVSNIYGSVPNNYVYLLENATYSAWKLDNNSFAAYADSLINHNLRKGKTQYLSVDSFNGAIYGRYIQLVNTKDYIRAKQVLEHYFPSIEGTDSTYTPLRELIPDRQREDYHEPVLPDSSNYISSLIDRRTLWLLLDVFQRGSIDITTLSCFEEARLKYLMGDGDYSLWLNRAFYEGVYSTFPATARMYISDYIRSSFQYNQDLMNLLTLQYNNSNSKCVYDAILFIKSASESIPVDIYKYTKTISPKEIQSYVDSLRLYDKESRGTVQSGLENVFLENEIGPHVKDVLYKNLSSYSEIQEKLRNDEICIEFFAAPSFDFNGDYSYRAAILAADYEEPIIVNICSSLELMDLVFKKDLYKTTEAYDILWAPVERFLSGINTVYFSTDRLLNICNLQALLTPGNKRLNQKYELVQLSSTKEILNDSHSHKYQSIALFGGIDYNSNRNSSTGNEGSFLSFNSTRSNLLRSFHRSDFCPLPFSLVEIDDISRFANKNGIGIKYFSATDGTESALKNLSGQSFSILHIATHGFYYSNNQTKGIDYFDIINTDNPLERCGLLFAGSLNSWQNPHQVVDKEDGILLGEEISRLDFSNVELVVLSACKSALGDINSEGVTGLRRAFKLSGAKSILITLNNIDDKASAYFMGAFYEKLFECKNRHVAYDFAINKMKSSKEYSNPKYWANFVLID